MSNFTLFFNLYSLSKKINCIPLIFLFTLITNLCSGQTGPLQVYEGFGTSALPTQGGTWAATSMVYNATASRSGAFALEFNGVGDIIRTPLIASPGVFSFWYKRSGTSTGTPQFTVETSPDNVTWTNRGATSGVTATYQQLSINLGALGLSNVYVRIKDTRASGTAARYVDDISWTSTTASANTTLIQGVSGTVNLTAGITYTLYDIGGINDQYPISQSSAPLIITPPSGYVVNANITSLGTESTYDFLKLYDGNGTTTTALHTGSGFSGTTAPGVFVSTHSSGALTFDFTSDSFTNGSGFVATITTTVASSCGVPTSLTATSIATSSATLGWTAPTSAPSNGYDIYYSATNTAPISSSTPSVNNNATASYSATSLSNATTYYWWVRSDCNTDTSAWVSGGSFTTACTVPNNPGAITITSPSATGFTLNYNAASPAPTSYILFYTNGATLTSIPTLVNGVTYTNSTAYTFGGNSYNCISNTFTSPSPLSGGTSNTQFNYFLFSKSTTNSCSGNPYYSSGVMVSTITCAAAPTVPVSSAISTTGATVSWTASAVGGGAGAISYTLEVYTDVGYTTHISGSPFSMGTSLSQALTGLTAATTYYYRIKANNDSCDSTYLTGSFATLKNEPTNQVTNLAAGAISVTAIPLTWTAAVAGAQLPDGYLVKASSIDLASITDPVDGTDPADVTAFTSNAANKKQTTGTAASTTTFTGTTPGTMYHYKVYSYTNSGTAIDFKTDAPATLSHATKPRAVNTIANETSSSTSLGFSWSSNNYLSATNEYLIFAKAGSAITAGTPVLNPATYTADAAFGSGTAYEADASAFCVYKGDGTTTLNLTGLNPSTTYHFLIYAVVDAANSNGSFSFNDYTFNRITLCEAEIAPTTTETFSTFTGTAPAPVCWSEATSTSVAAPSTLTIANSEWTSSTGFGNTGTNVAVKTNLYATDSDDWLISQSIDLGSTPGLFRVKYDMAVTSFNGAVSQTTLGSHIVRVIISTDGGVTWSSANTLKTYTGVGTYSNTGQTEYINLTSYSGVIKIAFVATTSSTTPDIDFHIDNFAIEAVPLPTITTVASSAACGTTATLTITGTNLSGATSVKVGGTTISPLLTNTATEITATLSAAVSGTVEVVTAGGTVTSTGSVAFAIAPTVTISATTQTNCSGSTNGTLTTITSTAGDYTTYAWSSATGVSGDATNGWTFNPTATTTYTLTASNSTSGCSNTITKTVTVNTSPSSVTISPSTSLVTPGETVNLIASGGTIQSNGNGVIGSGISDIVTIAPFRRNWGSSKVQVLFTAAELAALGMTANSKITSIGYTVASGTPASIPNFDLRAGLVSSNSLGTSFISGANTVILSSASYTPPTGNGVIDFTLPNPITWDGVSNLLIQSCFAINDSGITGAGLFVKSTAGASGRALYLAEDNNTALCSSTVTPTSTNDRPNLRVGFQNTVVTPTTWSPTTGLFTNAGATTAYTGGAATTVYAKPTATTTYTATATSSGCTASGTAQVNVRNSWTGAVSSSWNNTSNWSANTVPTSTDDIVISTSTPNAALLDIDYTLSSGKTLTISGTGTLTINSGRTVTIAGTADFGGKLVTFKSDATGSARLGQVTGTLTGASNVKVERYIAQGKRAYRFLAPGVTTTNFIKNNWQEATHITGSTTGANGFDQTASGSASMFTYNNQVATGTGWTAIANTNATNLEAEKGYRLLVRGDRTPSLLTSASADVMNTAITLSATGTLKTGTVTINATSTPVATNNTTNGATNGFSLVGNPYVSPIDWHNVTKTNLNDTYYIWDTNVGTSAQRGRYVSYSQATGINNYGNTGVSTADRYLQAGQAFFVKNTTLGTASSLVFNESNKAATSPFVLRTNNQNTSLSVLLYAPSDLAIGGYPMDGITSVFGTNFDAQIGYGDVLKLESSGENLAWFTQTKKLDINAQAPVVDTDVLLIKSLRLGSNKSYTFRIKATNFDTSLTGYLVDNYLNTQQVIDFTQDYFANFSTTADAQSFGEDRFKIVFSTALNNNQFTKDAFVVYPNPVVNNQFTIKLPATLSGNVKVTVHNLIGQEVYQVNTTAAPTLEIAPKNILSSGVYVVSVLGEGISSQQKITVQ